MLNRFVPHALLAGLVFAATPLLLPAPSAHAADAPPPNAPDFGPNVHIFDPTTPDLQQKISAIFAKQERAQFGTERFALLFKPGKYDLDVQVGFYTHVIGLGASPDDVSITGAVRAKAAWMRGNATCNFWRSVENLAITPTQDRGNNVWGVSQGTAFRRMHIKGNLSLADYGWSSGGFIADSKIDGHVNSGSQQQYLSRNAEWTDWRSGVWNMVFVGVKNPPRGNWPQRPYTIVDKTPIIREKPYLYVDAAGHYAVRVPPLRTNTTGISWSDPKADPGTSIPIDKFHIAKPGKDTTATINTALEAGKNILFTPGIYHLDSTIRVTRPETIVLGIGYPTLIADKGQPLMVVSDVDGVKIAHLLFEAGPLSSPTLLQVGEPGKSKDQSANPIFLFDTFARSGGANPGKCDSFLVINSNNVVGDNFWLWRADHGAGAKWDVNKTANGIIVNGNDVTCYALFVEHTQEYQTIWNGNGGRVYMYQCEMPYDPPSQDAWSNNGKRGWASYKVADNVQTHEAYGVGIYCVFTQASIIADTAIEAPERPGIKMKNLVTIRLSGRPDSGINSIINGKGEPVINKMKATMD